MPPQLEEVVGHAGVTDAEHLLPDLGHRRLQLRSGWLAALRLRRRRRRRRERPAVDLAVGGQRHGLETHEDLRHQRLRKAGSQVAPQLRPLLPHPIGHQVSPATRIGARHDHRLPHAGMLGQRRLDLTRLHGVPPHLLLAIYASDELQRPGISPAPAVSRQVEAPPRLFAVGVGHEPLGGQRGIFHVSPGQPHPDDADLPRESRRQQPQETVQHTDPDARYGPPHLHA